MTLSKNHRELDEDGVGKCSVPMWRDGFPDGFCDALAYGPQEKGQRRYGEVSLAWGKWFDGYCSGLACYDHGGPKSRVFKDGNAFCAVLPDFINLQESPAGFGASPEEARANLNPKDAK